MKKVNDMWITFAHNVLPQGVSKVQYGEMQKAFYGGVAAMMNVLQMMDPNTTEEDGMAQLESITKELVNFVETLGEKNVI
jgi:hypothetical protein